MRIISGSFKGKKIHQPIDFKTRPLKDLTKESIFNIISHSNKFNAKIENANILDLFSGVGSFGMECLSRGAKKVIFMENYPKVIPILKKNLTLLNSSENYEIIEKDVYENISCLNLFGRFDIIFLDPPYKDKNLYKLLKKIIEFKILNHKGIIILHRHKNGKDTFPSQFKIIEEKKYGVSKIIFLNF
tara:strand:+ start:93 stop:653 length:561 start_codon:yes stop_codon:yes gene_type:complete